MPIYKEPFDTKIINVKETTFDVREILSFHALVIVCPGWQQRVSSSSIFMCFHMTGCFTWANGLFSKGPSVCSLFKI